MLGEPTSSESDHRLWQSVDVVRIRFLAQFQNNDRSIAETEPVLNYIEQRAQTELAHWDVALIHKSSNETSFAQQDLAQAIGYQNRTEGDGSACESQPTYIRIGNKQRVADARMERCGLSQDLIAQAETEWRNENPDKNNIPGKAYRNKRVHPLLILHYLKIDPPPGKRNDGSPVDQRSSRTAYRFREQRRPPIR